MDTALGKRLTPENLTLLGHKLISKYTSQCVARNKEFLMKRKKYQKYAEGDYSDRKATDESSIYSKSNIPLEFITGVADFMVARTCEDIFGSDPWFAVIPQGPADKTLSEQLPRHFDFKLTEARFKALGRTASWRGFHIGEAIIKTTWRKEVDTSETLATVLCQGSTEVTDENGDFIFAEDFNLPVAELGLSLWAKTSIVPMDGQFADKPDLMPVKILLDKDGQPVLADNGEYWFETDLQTIADAKGQPVGDFLSKSPIISQQEGEEFCERLIENTQVLFEGLDDALVEHGDFAVELNIRHLQESKGTFHRLSLRRSVLRDQYGMTEDVEAMIGGDSQVAKSDEKKPRAGEGEVGFDPEDDDPEYEVIECYARIDVDGKMVRVYALVEKKTETVIVCDYWANVTPAAINPFAAIVPCPVPGRWYGRGYHEIYAEQADFIDRTFNAIIYRNKMHANPPGFIRPSAFKEGSVVKNFLISAGKIHQLNNDFTAKQALEFVEFPDLDQRTWEILQLVMQMAQVRSGVTGASQGAVTNLPSNGTATGVQSIMMSGSVLHKLPIECVKEGFEDSLDINAQILYANQNRDETFAYMEGDATQLVTLNARNVKNLRLNIKLLLTRLHEREALESAKAAIEAVAQYLSVIPENEKDQVRPLFIQVLKALRITGADSILRHAIPPAPDQKPPVSERFNLALNYKDAPPDIRRQMEAEAGYQPSAEAAPAPGATPAAPGQPGQPPAGHPDGPETPAEQAGDKLPENAE